MSTFLRVWLVPIVIAVISAAGLLSALTGNGIWDALSWVTLGVPLVVIAYFLNKHLRVKRS